MLKIQKGPMFSGRYDLLKMGQKVGTLRRGFWGREAICHLDTGSLRMEQSGFWISKYLLLNGNRELLRAEVVPFSNRVGFTFENGYYELMPKGWFNGDFKIERGPHLIGSISAYGFFHRSAEVELPDSFPVMLQVFLGWTALCRWADAASASHST